MTTEEIVSFTTPVSRFVNGDLTVPDTKDADGAPLVVKTGPNAGQPRVNYRHSVAVKKGAEQHWLQTEWGMKIGQVAVRDFPGCFDPATGQLYPNRQDFAFKVTDGDSTVPNKKGRKPCENEGWPGHWILHFSNGYQSKVYNANGTAELPDPTVVKRGHYIQVNCTVRGNGSNNQPGVYLNHQVVAHAGYGPEISNLPDPSTVGFGGALPPEASAIPLAGLSTAGAPPAAAPAAVVQQPAAAPAPVATVVQTPTPGAVAPAHDLVQPTPQPAAVAPAAVAPAPPAPPPAPPAPPPAPPAPPAPPPAPPAAPVEEKYIVNGSIYTKSQLLAMPDWTEAHIATLARA